MISIEQVEKLLEYADVTFEEARDALEHCGGNLLDAIVHLERQGKVTSRGGTRSSGAITVLPGNAQEGKDYTQPKGTDFAEEVRKFFKWVGEEFDKAGQSIFVASHKEYDLISMPTIIFLGIAIFGFYFVLPAMLIGAVCGVKYRFESKDGEVKEDTDDSEKL